MSKINKTKSWNLFADIGGTQTRLGIAIDKELIDIVRQPTTNQENFIESVVKIRERMGTNPEKIVAACAGPVQKDSVQLTNAELSLSNSDLVTAVGTKEIYLINDFAAAAWSVAEITDADVTVVQGQAIPPSGTRLVVGVGTGLGVGCLIWTDGGYHATSGEGGHIGLSPRHRMDVAIFEAAHQLSPNSFFSDSLTLEAEMFLSGTGLPILYQAIAISDGQTDVTGFTAPDILTNAYNMTDKIAVKTVTMFTSYLGALLGDLSVLLVPSGGIFIVGGVAQKNLWLFNDRFCSAFNQGGRFSKLRNSMNIYVSKQFNFGLVGAHNFCKARDAKEEKSPFLK